MARIRTVKPELFRHEELYQAEVVSGLPLRLVFIGLFTVADREGRFKWRPNEVKLDILPWDNLDFSRVLDTLATRGFVQKYRHDGQTYGCIPSFPRHQVINGRERDSILPDPNNCEQIATRDPRVTVSCITPHNLAQGEGKGREGKGTGREGNRNRKGKEGKELRKGKPCAAPKTSLTWEAYSRAYYQRHDLEPIRNAKVNSQISQLVSRLGEKNAPAVAEFYVWHSNPFYVQKRHPVGLMLADAETLYTEWKTGKTVTRKQAQEGERSTVNAQAVKAFLNGGDDE